MSQGSLPELCQGRIGTTLKGKWTLERLLGVGGMAAVYVGLHKIGRRDAIKILHPEVARSREFLARFEQEAQVSNQFQHPGAVEVRDIDVSDEGCPFLVMELLEGESLGERAQRLDGIAEVDLLRYVDELLDVLAAAHAKGIVHRDIKLDNLFVLSTGELKVLDFGIARMRSAPAMTRVGVRLGTTAYMPPEQVRGEEVDGRADLFAVGATMFRLIARRRIHEAPTDGEMLEKMSSLPAPSLRDVTPNVDARLALIVDRALAFRKHERYPDAQTMQSDVRALRSGAEPPYATATARGAVAPASIAMGGDRVASSAFAMEATGVEPSSMASSALPAPSASPVSSADPTRVERRVASQAPGPLKTQALAVPRPAPRPTAVMSSTRPSAVAPSAPTPPVAPQQLRSEPPVSLAPPQQQQARVAQGYPQSHPQSHRPESAHSPSNRPPASVAQPYSAVASSVPSHPVTSSVPSHDLGPESISSHHTPMPGQGFGVASPGAPQGYAQAPYVASGSALGQTTRSAQSFVPPHLAMPAQSPSTPRSFATPHAMPQKKSGSAIGWLFAVGALVAVAASVGLYLVYGVSAEPAAVSQERDDDDDEETSASPRKKKSSSSDKAKESAAATAAASEQVKADESKPQSAKVEEKKEAATAAPNFGTPKTMPGTDPAKPADLTPAQTTVVPSARSTATPIGAGSTSPSAGAPGRNKPKVRL